MKDHTEAANKARPGRRSCPAGRINPSLTTSGAKPAATAVIIQFSNDGGRSRYGAGVGLRSRQGALLVRVVGVFSQHGRALHANGAAIASRSCSRILTPEALYLSVLYSLVCQVWAIADADGNGWIEASELGSVCKECPPSCALQVHFDGIRPVYASFSSGSPLFQI